MLGSNGFEDIIPLIRKEIRDFDARKTALAEVTAKDGTGVYVKRFGSASQEGPYPSLVSGVLQVGQMVQLLNADSGLPVVGWPIEQSERANYMTLVGADMDEAETTSASVYELLLEVDGLDIPADSFFWVTYLLEMVASGTVAPTKSLLLQANGTTTIASLSSTDSGGSVFGGNWIYVSPFSGDGFASQKRFASSVLTGGIVFTDAQDITKLSLYGKTNDTDDENDILRVGKMLVFA